MTDRAIAAVDIAVALGYGTVGQVVVSNGGTIPPGWGDISSDATAIAIANAASAAAASAITISNAASASAASAVVIADAALPLAGGTMSGALTLFSDPTARMQPATQNYTDNRFLTRGMLPATRQKSLSDGTTLAIGNSLNSRMFCQVPARGGGITDITVSFPGWYVNGGDVVMPQAYTVVECVVEYPVGVFTPFSFSGSQSLTVPPGFVDYYSDKLSIYIPPGAAYRIKSNVTWASGTLPLGRMVACQIIGEWSNWGTGLANQTETTTTFTNSTFTTIVSGFGPSVFATYATYVPSVFIEGDSIIEAVAVDVPDPLTGAMGIERGLRGQIPSANIARYGESLGHAPIGGSGGVGWLGSNKGRSDLARSSATDVLWQYSRNDLASGVTSLTLQTLFLTGAAPPIARRQRVWAMTALPSTSSTDAFATVGNQSLLNTSGEEAQRVLWNTYLRANWQALGFYGLIDIAACVETSLNSGIWKADGPGNFGFSAFATLSGGVVTAVNYATFTTGTPDGAGGGFLPSGSVIPCFVTAYPGTPGSGAVVTVSQVTGFKPVYTVVFGGSGYTYSPIVSPMAAWTLDGVHPNFYGYSRIIAEVPVQSLNPAFPSGTGINPDMFA